MTTRPVLPFVTACAKEIVGGSNTYRGFMAGLLRGLAHHSRQGRSLAELTPASLDVLLGTAARVGAEVCRVMGAATGLPREEAIGTAPWTVEEA